MGEFALNIKNELNSILLCDAQIWKGGVCPLKVSGCHMTLSTHATHFLKTQISRVNTFGVGVKKAPVKNFNENLYTCLYIFLFF